MIVDYDERAKTFANDQLQLRVSQPCQLFLYKSRPTDRFSFGTMTSHEHVIVEVSWST